MRLPSNIKNERLIFFFVGVATTTLLTAATWRTMTHEEPTVDADHPIAHAKATYQNLLDGKTRLADFEDVASYFEDEGLQPSGEITARFLGGDEDHWTYWVATDFYGNGNFRVLAAIIRVGKEHTEVRQIIDPKLIERWTD